MSEPVLSISVNDDVEPSIWDLGGDYVVSIGEDGQGHFTHPCSPNYWRPSHTVGIDFPGRVHILVSRQPLSITPSLFCDPSLGGCGCHVWITEGKVR
jgi:hypothetical protein